MSHMPTPRETGQLARVRATTTEEGEIIIVGIPVGTSTFVRAHTKEVVKENHANAWCAFWQAYQRSRRRY